MNEDDNDTVISFMSFERHSRMPRNEMMYEVLRHKLLINVQQ